ncbi:ATP-binding protein [Gulosibacter sp. ACHW.36C]|uniref:histidine kinase n=1 Tax=Gulosibacter sediminis TaxID=1729695 RepID=A0ABY4MVM7_9MICO|nr:ATP-binding protein [Gulosibacter sediminis]UQN14481.1 ATP-binding protein [Gulosibacter sediminis]
MARFRWSAATLVFVLVALASALFMAVTSTYLVIDARADARGDATVTTHAVSIALADSPLVREALAGDDAAATETLQPVVNEVEHDAGLDFVTIMRPDGTRVTHPTDAQVGAHYLGTIPDAPEPLSEEFVGSLGASIRTIVPVLDDDRVIGWVSSGITIRSIDAGLPQRLGAVAVVSLFVLLLGLGGAVLARRGIRQLAGDLPTSTIRDAVSSRESLRTLSSAMRAQAHEHGNRLHAAVGLLELGRTDEAISILTETAGRQQLLLDIAADGSRLEPAVQALLLGKASAAAERGIEWSIEIDPEAPRSTLSAVDAVSVCGNLIDNALDAAGEGGTPRWVEVSIMPGEDGAAVFAIADSGPGFAPGIEARMFEEGVSSKPSDASGRGVGLALVRSIVDAVGGTIEVSKAPTLFTVTLPGRAVQEENQR